MERYCSKCGAKLPDEGTFCPQCGAPRASEGPDIRAIPLSQEPAAAPQTAAPWSAPNAAPPVWAEPAPEKGREPRKFKWWMAAIPALLVVALAVLLLWEPLSIRINPLGALAKAAANTAESLADRYEGNPISMMEKAYTSDQTAGEGTIAIRVPENGEIQANISVNADRNTRQTLMEMGMTLNYSDYGVSVSGDLDFYMDPDFMAFNLEQATNGTFYGIAYDTFGSDIRSNPLLTDSLSEEQLVVLEELVSGLQEVLNRENTEFQLSEEYSELFAQFLKEQKPTVSTEKINLGENVRSCHKICYTIPVSELGELMDAVVDLLEDDEMIQALDMVNTLEYDWEMLIENARNAVDSFRDSDGDMTVCYYIYKNRLVNLSVNTTISDDMGDEMSADIAFLLGEDPARNDLVLSMDLINTDDEMQRMELVFSTQKDGSTISHGLELCVNGDDTDERIFVSYEWDREDGDLELVLQMDSPSISSPLKVKQRMILKEEEDGFLLEISDFSNIPDMQDIDLDVFFYFHEGKSIKAPKYTNIKNLTTTDLYDILMNIENSYG